jgi:hypothetical protein
VNDSDTTADSFGIIEILSGTSNGQIENDLTAAITNLPELQEQQRSNAIHTAITAKVLNEAATRKAPELFKMESDCFLGENVEIEKIRELVMQVPDVIDRLRLVTVAYLCHVIPDDVILSFAGETDRDLSFLKDCLGNFKLGNRAEPGFLATLFNLSSGQNEDNDIVKNLPIPRMTRKILDGNRDGFTWADGGRGEPGKYGNVYVFVIGPGSYLEYHGIQQLCDKANVTFGCTSVPRPSEFMTQLSHIGDRS